MDTTLLAVIPLLMFTALALDLTYSLELQGNGLKFKNSCVTTSMIICEQELVLVGVCFTRANDSLDIAVYGVCPYVTLSGPFNTMSYYHINFTISQLTEQTCGALNRKGLLCSECYEGYGPAAYAFANECVKCHGSTFKRWALYLFVVLFPITIFYVIVIVFNIRATSPPFAAYVLFCQIFASLDRIFFPGSTKFSIHDPNQVLLLLARTLSGVWNLDFGRYIIPPFCLSEGINSYHVLFLDYIPGFYPMILIFITYILVELHSSNFKPIVFLWKPFHKCFVRVRRMWDPRASMVNAFTTFLFLSFSKILFVSCFSLQRVIIRTSSCTIYKLKTLFYNPNIKIYSYENLPFILLGFSLSTVFVFIPTLFLCCYPFARKTSFCCCCGKQHVLSMFMDTFQGHYKDGTNGTYDWRFLAGLYPLLRVFIIYTVHNHKLLPRNACPPQMLYCFIVTVIVSFIRPYKRLSHNLIETLLLILITFMMWSAPAFQTIAYSQKYRMRIALLQVVPHSILAVVILFKVAKLLLHHLKLTYNCRYAEKLSLTWLDAFWSRLNRMMRNDEDLSFEATELPTQARSYGTIN